MKASLTISPWLDNSGMKKHFQKAFDAMEAAKPASGFCPEKEAESTVDGWMLQRQQCGERS
jgi:hypothetical protein